MAESSQNNGWVESYLEALVRPPCPLCPLATCWTARSAQWRRCASAMLAESSVRHRGSRTHGVRRILPAIAVLHLRTTAAVSGANRGTHDFDAAAGRAASPAWPVHACLGRPDTAAQPAIACLCSFQRRSVSSPHPLSAVIGHDHARLLTSRRRSCPGRRGFLALLVIMQRLDNLEPSECCGTPIAREVTLWPRCLLLSQHT